VLTGVVQGAVKKLETRERSVPNAPSFLQRKKSASEVRVLIDVSESLHMPTGTAP